MTTLHEFLLDRFAEDIKLATAPALNKPDAPNDATDAFLNRWHPYDVVVDLEAKRYIVEIIGPDCDHHHCQHTLASLALAYQNHPDYREEWRPQ